MLNNNAELGLPIRLGFVTMEIILYVVKYSDHFSISLIKFIKKLRVLVYYSRS